MDHSITNNYKLENGPWIQSVNETGLKLWDKTIENINTTQHSSTIIDYFINVSIEKLQWYWTVSGAMPSDCFTGLSRSYNASTENYTSTKLLLGWMPLDRFTGL